MLIQHNIKTDLVRKGCDPIISIMQGDISTHQIVCTILKDRKKWLPPSGTTILVRYSNSYGTGCTYDTLPDGEPAWEIHGNTVSVILAPQVLALPGSVTVVVSFLSGAQVLSVFKVLVMVEGNAFTDTSIQGNCTNITGFLPAPDSAAVGQIFSVEEVNSDGRVIKVKAVDAPTFSNVQDGVVYSPSATVMQTETGAVIAVTDKNGTTTATILHGEDGPIGPQGAPGPKGETGATGPKGANGKSAFTYAQEGGYTGTEEEFAGKLASGSLLVMMTSINNVITADKTVSECIAAYKNGTAVYGCLIVDDASYVGPMITALYDDTAVSVIFECVDNNHNNGDRFVIQGFNDGENEAWDVTAMTEIPTALPNPAALTFTGAVTGTYDGSAAKTINIPSVPSALKNPNALTINGTAYDGSEAKDFTATINAMIAAKLPTALPNPQKLKFIGAAAGEYDGSEELTIEIPAGGSSVETETVLSDNLLDKSLLTQGQVFYYGSSGYQLVSSTYSYYGFIPLRGAGTYRTKFQAHVHSSTSTRIALVNDNNAWVANATGTLGEVAEDNNWVDFEFVVTQDMISAGATKIAFDVYSLYLDKTMIVKDRDYPSEYIPYGYIEVATDSGKKQDNVLCGKTAVFLGDSICAGTTVGTDSEYHGYGWAGLIGEPNHMNWTNYGKDGATITPIAENGSGLWVSTYADKAIAEHPAADYVIFEGGCNDADQMKEDGLGEISSDYATFDTTTFSGALESLILKLVMAYPYARIGYIIPQKIYTGYANYTAANHIHRKYFDRAVEICQKWGIPVVDLWNGSPLNPKLSTASIYYSDGIQHLTLAGYQRITPQIEAFMRSL